MLLEAKYGPEMILLNHFCVPEVSSRGKYVAQFCFVFLLINELANEIMQRGRRGLQLIPDLTDIFILLFADNVILISDTVSGLQNQLNVLFDTANCLSLFVNMDKTKIVVFQNGVKNGNMATP